MRKLVLVSIVTSLLVGCATVPITGRSQLSMISDDHVRVISAETYSRFLSLARQKDAVLSANESSQAAATLASVKRVSERVVDAAGLRDRYYWETVVVKSREANAFVTPNGKIVVFTGLLPVAKTEAALAAVIGHEVGHVIGHHQAERMSQVLAAQIAITAVDVALAASNPKYQPVAAAALGVGAQYGVLLPFSRLHESEADHIGLLLMAKAGYEPSEAAALWQRMEAAGGSGPWEFLSTHPSHATRIAQIQEWLPEANLYYSDSSRPLPSGLAELREAIAARATKVALAPTAPMPSFQPGFWYQFKMSNRPTSTTNRVVGLETCPSGQCYVVESDGGSTVLLTSDLALYEQRNSNGTWTRAVPGLRSLKWPLSVGNHWEDSVTIEESSGRKQTTQLKGDVVSYESASVPAGRFMAYKIVVTLGGRRFRELWYAPETRTVVKSISYDAQGQSTVGELANYQKSDEPVGIANVPSDRPNEDARVRQPSTLKPPEGISCPQGAAWTGNGCIAPR